MIDPEAKPGQYIKLMLLVAVLGLITALITFAFVAIVNMGTLLLWDRAAQALGMDPRLFTVLHHKYYVDEFYATTLLRANRAVGVVVSWFDRWILDGLVVGGLSTLVRAISFVNHLLDELVINRGFDRGCGTLQGAGALNRHLQSGLAQRYLRIATAAIFLLTAFLMFLARKNGP